MTDTRNVTHSISRTHNTLYQVDSKKRLLKIMNSILLAYIPKNLSDFVFAFYVY